MTGRADNDLGELAPDDDVEAKFLGMALRVLRDRKGLSQLEAAVALGFSSGEAYRVYEAGMAPTIFKPSMQFRLAKVFGFTLKDLMDERDAIAGRSKPVRRAAALAAGLPITGRVQAGAWLGVDELSQVRPKTYPALSDPRFPHAAQWLDEVSGDSMDRLGILDGDLLHCVDAQEIGYAPRSGDLVEVIRSRYDGQELEVTIKQIELTEEGWMLMPRSYNPKWAQPLHLGEGAGQDEIFEVRIRALVLASIRRF